MPDDLVPGRDPLKHLGHILAHPGEPAIGAAAGDLGLVDDDLARQMCRQRLAQRRPSRPGFGFLPGRLRGGLLGLVLLEVLEPQLELVDRLVELLRRVAEPRPPQRRELDPQLLDLDRGPAELGAGRGQLVIAFGQHPPQRGELIDGSWLGAFHERKGTGPALSSPLQATGRTRGRVNMSQQNQRINQHAAAGRAVHAGMRQSIPSISIASCAVLRVSVPSLAWGQTKRPRSSRLA